MKQLKAHPTVAYIGGEWRECGLHYGCNRIPPQQ
jgi:hypothetical protein